MMSLNFARINNISPAGRLPLNFPRDLGFFHADFCQAACMRLEFSDRF
jgi:hypothetical protein